MTDEDEEIRRMMVAFYALQDIRAGKAEPDSNRLHKKHMTEMTSVEKAWCESVQAWVDAGVRNLRADLKIRDRDIIPPDNALTKLLIKKGQIKST